MSCQLQIQDLGKIAYEPALQLQREIHQIVRDARGSDHPSSFHMLLVEHDPPVITLSKRSSSKEHLIATEAQLEAAGVSICQTDRGGDITYHGLGQLVGYPICDLNALHLRVHGYMRFLESCIIKVLSRFDINGHRVDSATGVWVGDAKICAMGVRVSRWISMHGFALNVAPDLSHFDLIVPCGLEGRSITSMSKLLGEACPTMGEVRVAVGEVFTNAIANQAQVQKESQQ